MQNTTALFSGQGSQYPGMGADLIDSYPAAKRIYECAGDILGMDIIALSKTATEEELAKTIVSQPVIFTLSVAAYSLAKEMYGEPRAVAGHSLGEFAALYAAGAFSLEDGFKLIKARSNAMEKAGASGEAGAMYAIIGKDLQLIAEVCAEAGGFVEPVNLNMPTQTVISGEVAAAEKAANKLSELGAKAVRLGVSSAFHTKMMLPAATEFQAEAAKINFTQPKLDFYSNLSGDKLNIENFPQYFAQHMVSAVKFTDEIAAMVRDGITACVEFGPKKTVSTFAKKNARSLAVANCEDHKTLLGLREFFGKL